MRTAGYLLEEWARWCQGGDTLEIGWPPSTPFGKLIKPDPRPASLPIDVERAYLTDRIVARLPTRYRFLVKLHYLDPAPIDAKARRMRLGRNGYLHLIEGVCRVVAIKLDRNAETC